MLAVGLGGRLMSTLGNFVEALDGDGNMRQDKGEVSLTKKLLVLLLSGVIGWAPLGFIESAVALEVAPVQGIYGASGQGIYAALLDLDSSSLKPAAAREGGDAFSAL